MNTILWVSLLGLFLIQHYFQHSNLNCNIRPNYSVKIRFRFNRIQIPKFCIRFRFNRIQISKFGIRFRFNRIQISKFGIRFRFNRIQFSKFGIRFRLAKPQFVCTLASCLPLLDGCFLVHSGYYYFLAPNYNLYAA